MTNSGDGMMSRPGSLRMLLDDLKQQTRSHHDRLEQMNGMAGSRAEYVSQLEKFYGYVSEWEHRLAAKVPPNDSLRAGREKTSWLEADLDHFGYSSSDREELPRCEAYPDTPTRIHLLGACYVMEGSTLGGQFISRHLEKVIGLSDGCGYRYFNSYGSETRARWQEFREELMRHSSPENDPVIVEAATGTFESLANWFASRRFVSA